MLLSGSIKIMEMENNIEQKRKIFDFMEGIHSKNEDIDRWEMELLKYDTDWNQLMPVVEKIETMADPIIGKVYVSINGKSCSMWNYFNAKGILRDDSAPDSPFSKRDTGKSKIEATYKAVLRFHPMVQHNNNQQSK
jgi:hypothetical protein